MLFRGLDLNEEQRAQVGSIMREQMEKGRNQQESFKSETRDRLTAVLTEEQLGQFDQNAKKMEQMRSKMDRKKGGPKGKGPKHKKKGKHKPHPQHD
jgi:Spy/CpxP family protein refolding chaperone